MGNYNFNEDLKVAHSTEKEVAELLCRRLNLTLDTFCNNSACDIVLKNEDTQFTFEVKEDFMCERTGNVSVEYESRGKRSGIAASQADAWVYKIHEPNGKVSIYMIPTTRLVTMCKEKLYHRTVNGGDEGSNTMNFLFTLEIIKGHFIFVEYV